MREEHGSIHTTIYRIDNRWRFAMKHRELNPVLCDDLRGGMEKEMGEGTLSAKKSKYMYSLVPLLSHKKEILP